MLDTRCEIILEEQNAQLHERYQAILKPECAT